MKFLVELWKKLKNIPWERKSIRVSILLLLSVSLCLWDHSLYCPAQIPDIVFQCVMYTYRYDEQKTKQYYVCEITFIDRYGKCYYSDDPSVCNGFDGNNEDFINAYKAGELDGKITLCNSCSGNEVRKRYRKIYKQARKGTIQIIPYGGLTMEMSYPHLVWYGLYFDESGEMQSVILHEKRPGYGELTNDKQANQTYGWCNEIMGEKECYGQMLP